MPRRSVSFTRTLPRNAPYRAFARRGSHPEVTSIASKQLLRINTVVHPLQSDEPGGFSARLEQPVAQLARNPGRVIDVAIEARRQLRSGGAQIARSAGTAEMPGRH